MKTILRTDIYLFTARKLIYLLIDNDNFDLGFHSIAIFILEEHRNDSNLSSFQGAAEGSKNRQKLRFFF